MVLLRVVLLCAINGAVKHFKDANCICCIYLAFIIYCHFSNVSLELKRTLVNKDLNAMLCVYFFLKY